MTLSTLAPLLFSFLFALFLVPTVRAFAIRLGLIDRPDLVRKLQTTPIALGGGIAVFFAMVFAVAASIQWDRFSGSMDLGIVHSRYYQLFAAAGAILAIGFIDDLWSLRGRQKLLAQCLVIAALVGAGTRIDSIGLFGYSFELGVFGFPITMMWLVIAVNALNLIDGADGVASTVGGIIALGLGCMSVAQGAPLNAAVCFAIAGSLFGFLCFNRPPASIYLGDAGSMMVGLLVGVLSIWSDLKDHTVLSSAPIAVLAIPLFDSTAAILRRWLTGRSIYTTDRAHLHHLLQQRWGDRRMLLFVVVLCGSTSLLSVLSVTYHLPWLAGLGTCLVLGLMIASRSFGFAEFQLVTHRVGGFMNSFTVLPHRIDQARRHADIMLQGDGPWSKVWEPLVEFAEMRGLSSLRLDINLAWVHQGHHARWQAERMPERAYQMTIVLPLLAHRPGLSAAVPIGHLRVVAPANDPAMYGQLAILSDFLQDLESEVDKAVSEVHQANVRPHHGGGVDPSSSIILSPEPISDAAEDHSTVSARGGFAAAASSSVASTSGSAASAASALTTTSAP